MPPVDMPLDELFPLAAAEIALVAAELLLVDVTSSRVIVRTVVVELGEGATMTLEEDRAADEDGDAEDTKGDEDDDEEEEEDRATD